MIVERTPDGGYRIELTMQEGHSLLYYLNETDHMQDPEEPYDLSFLAAYPDVLALRDELHHA